MDTDDENFSRDLMAFADGELSSADARRVLDRLCANPDALDILRGHQRMTNAARRSYRDQAPPASDDFRRRVAAAVSEQTAFQQTARRSARFKLGPAPWSIAALLLVGVGVLLGHPWHRQQPPTAVDPVVAPSVVSMVTHVHAKCSRLAVGLHSAAFPVARGDLAAAVRADLHTDHPYPDLTSIGFRYRGAGPCPAPDPTVHLLYRSTDPASDAAVSLFVQPFDGQYPLEKDRVYTLTTAASPFPIVTWRTDRVVYFLLADDEPTERAALAVVRKTH